MEIPIWKYRGTENNQDKPRRSFFHPTVPRGARILRMSLQRSLAVRFAAVAACLCVAVAHAPAQAVPSATAPETGVVLAKLFPPLYPPLARQASISGDVKVELRVRKDGSVESADAVSGHAILRKAALESARKSQFECKGCTDAVAYLLTYSFVVKKFSPDFCKLPVKPPEVTVEQNHVTLTANPLCVQTEQSAGASPDESR